MSVKIQLRHDTASNWTTANPTLSAGELGFETDTGKIKVGTGSTAWTSLAYAGMTPTEVATAITNAVSGVIDLSPSTLDTLNELAAAINDDPDFFNTVATNLSNHASDTTNVHGIADTSLLETTSGAQSKADTAEAAANTYTDSLIGDITVDGTTGNTVKDRIDTAVANLVDAAPSTLDTLNEIAAAIGDNENFFQAVDNIQIAQDNLSTDLGTHVQSIFSVHGITDTRDLVYEVDMVDAINTHSTDTTDVHGIGDTSLIALTTSPTFSGSVSLPAGTTIETTGGLLQVGPTHLGLQTE